MRTSRACFLALALAAPSLGSHHASAEAATLELLSRTTTAADALGTATEPVLSADGRYVAFLSSAPNLAPGQEDENGSLDVFLHDRLLDTTTLVSHAPGSPSRASTRAAPGEYGSLDISADGRYLAFSGRGVHLVQGAAGSLAWNVFLWDRVTDTTTLVSHAAGSPGTAADDSSFIVRISADGNFLAFTSLATNLVAGQVDNSNPFGGTTVDVFLWNRAADTTRLVSHRSGTPAGNSVIAGNQASFAPALSADGGVVVFATFADDLLPAVDDTNGAAEVYAWQRSTDTLSLVSRAAASPQAAAGAWHEGLTVSADGRYVAFASHSSDLVPGHVDGNPSTPDAFLYDRSTGEMRLVSRRNDVPFLGGGIFDPTGISMSDDGRYVAFSSAAPDLVPQVDTNQAPDVFVYDRVTGLVALASHRHDSVTTAGSPGATSAPSPSGAPRLSADGRFLVFQSIAVDLVAGQADVPNTVDVFLYDTASRSVTLVSRTRASASTAGNLPSSAPVLSADGSVAAFLSEATNLGEGQSDPYGFFDLFLYHRTSGEITSASRRDSGLPPPITALFSRNLLGSLSADGRSVAFQSDHVFLRDTVADTTLLLSPPLSPPYTRQLSRNPVLSADGRFVAFLSDQNTPGSTTGLFLYDRAAGTYTLVNYTPGIATPSGQADGFASGFALSADGRYVAYACDGCLLPGATRFQAIFLYDRLSGTNILVSRAANTSLPAFPADGESYSPAISADGRHIVFWSFATNLVPGQIDVLGTQDLFVYDREAGVTSLVTHTPGSPTVSAGAPPPSLSPADLSAADLSADGRFIAFRSALTHLVSGQVDANAGLDVFLHDQLAGTTVLVSHAASSPATEGNGPSSSFGLGDPVSMSADGRFVAYESFAADLVAGATDINGIVDVFLYDRVTGTSTLVSHADGAPLTAASGSSRTPLISADGRRVAFLSTAFDLLPGQALTVGWYNLYVQDRESAAGNASARVFIARAFRSPRPFVPFPGGNDDDPLSFVPHLSADGRRIGFNSEAALVPGDYNGTWDVYLWDQDGTEEPEGPVAVTPCRLLDTRRRAERPVLTSNVPRTVTAHGRCGVPDTAKRVLVKVTVFNPSGKGNLRFYPGDVTASPSGILRFERGVGRTETFTLPLGTDGTLAILPFVSGRGTVHGAVEVTAYED